MSENTPNSPDEIEEYSVKVDLEALKFIYISCVQTIADMDFPDPPARTTKGHTAMLRASCCAQLVTPHVVVVRPRPCSGSGTFY